jgi:outer membrane protein OmpA-like peptidoglycan-associated protein
VPSYRWERRRGGALLPLVVAVLGLVVIGLLQSIPNRHAIEADLTDRSVHALQGAGLSTVDVSFVGRDGTVRAHSASDADRAAAIVRAVEGVRVVVTQVVAGPTVNLAIDAGKVVCTGAVASTATRAALVAAATATFGADAVSDRLTVDAHLDSKDLGDKSVAGLGEVLKALGKDVTATVDLSGGVITLTGTVPAQSVRDAAVRAATQVVGQPSSVVDRLTVAVPQPSPSPSTSPSDNAAQQAQAQLAALPRITFDVGSAALTADGQAVVVRAAAVLTANPAVRIRIEGHTDSTGNDRSNQELSLARAQAVLNALVAQGISADRLSAAGFGSSRPEVPDTTPANQAINRRVAFVVQS